MNHKSLHSQLTITIQLSSTKVAMPTGCMLHHSLGEQSQRPPEGKGTFVSIDLH